MSPIAWIVIGGIAITIIALILWSARRRPDAELSDAARQEIQNSLATQGQTLATQINHLMQSVTQQLGQVRAELQTGIASSGQITADAQRNVSQQLVSATEAVRQISQQIGSVQKLGDDLSKASQALQQVLGGAKTRGQLGELGLDRMLQDALPQGSYELQHRFATGDFVDAIVRCGEKLICIDSKFPLEAYRRLMETGEDARKEFAQAVRKHADDIAGKYILPGEQTLDIALMFVPSETIYYELLMTEDAKHGRLDAYCRTRAVVPVSPNTLYAYLSAILLGLRGLQIEENARHLLGEMAGLKKQLDTFSDVFEKMGTHLRHAQQSYEDADSRLGRTRNALDQMSRGVLPEAPPKALETSNGE